RDAFSMSGDVQYIQSVALDKGIIRHLEEIVGCPILLAGGALARMSARGSIRGSTRARGYAASCHSDIPGAPSCCPHLSYIEDWGTVWAGALAYAFVPSVGFSFAPLHIP